jgi:hypothetical protein
MVICGILYVAPLYTNVAFSEEEDISRLISIHQKYRKTGNDYLKGSGRSKSTTGG